MLNVDLEPRQVCGLVKKLVDQVVVLVHAIAQTLGLHIQGFVLGYELTQTLVIQRDYFLVGLEILKGFGLVLSQGVHSLLLDSGQVCFHRVYFLSANLDVLAHLHG